MQRVIQGLGKRFIDMVNYFGSVGHLAYLCVTNMFKRPFYFDLFLEQIYFLGSKSLVLIGVTAISVGMVMTLQFGFGMERFGAKMYVPKIVALSIIRELGPVFTCLMLAGRVGSGIASEIGSMKVTQQLDAIRALGTSPIKRLVIPRVLALLIIAPVCTVIADMIGVLGGLFVSIGELKTTGRFFMQQTWEVLMLYDLLMGTSKTLFFSVIITLTACHYGFNAKGGTQGVGDATTQAVVTSSVLIFLTDFVLSKIFWIMKI